MKDRIPVRTALASDRPVDVLTVKGWVRTKRIYKDVSFIELNDGSCLKNIQVVLSPETDGYEKIRDIATGSAVGVSGRLRESPGKGQKWELSAKKLCLIGPADDGYPLQKKGHSLEYLREIAHLRPRSNLFGCIFRVRSRMAFAVHSFFQGRGFHYIHTPIITSSDCEGAGELFQVTTLPLDAVPKQDGKVDFSRDFFGVPAYLTVSGQLDVELFATALSNVYTFGPTFRAENSNTPRHVSEFWMIEPEMAFCDLSGDADLAEEFIRYLVRDLLEHCPDEVAFFERFVDRELRSRLELVSTGTFERVSYAEVVRILADSGKKFEYPVSYGANLQTEHERFLTEDHFQSPVAVIDYPAAIKPFYMRRNDDGKTVAALDVLVPRIGEIIGGSQREERMDCLIENMKERGLNEKDYGWYLDTRRYGSVPHSGFGMGFERLLMFVTGIGNIRDVIPFARTPGNASF
jgi:asparaginyl-tRNA synthetase